jgi:ribosomal protein L37AE/L43A
MVNNMTNCPVCSDILLRHVRSSETYWFCRRCRTELLEKAGKIYCDHPATLPSPSMEGIRVGRVLDKKISLLDKPLELNSINK